MLEGTTEIRPPIGHPSTLKLKDIPSAKKVQSLHNLFNKYFKTDFLEKGSNFFQT